MSDPQSLHKYAYTHGDPITFHDPTGELEGLAGLVVSVSIGASLGGTVSKALGGSFVEGAVYGGIGAGVGFIASPIFAAAFGTSTIGYYSAVASSGFVAGAVVGGARAWWNGKNATEVFFDAIESGIYSASFSLIVGVFLSPTGKLPTKPQHPDVRVMPKNPASRPVTSTTTPGEYVFAQDADGVVHILPNGPHLHPTILGGGREAAASGELIIGANGVVTELNNLSYTFQHDASTLVFVKSALERVGLVVPPNAVNPKTF